VPPPPSGLPHLIIVQLRDCSDCAKPASRSLTSVRDGEPIELIFGTSKPRVESHRPAARRAAYSICAAPSTVTIAATVACNFTGSTTVGFGGQLIKIAVGLTCRFDEDDGQPAGQGGRTVGQFNGR